MSEDIPQVMGLEGYLMELERLVPSSLAARLDRERPYDGQPHTSGGERGRQEVKGVTMRDVEDCFVRACYDASGLEPKDWPGTVFDLPWDEMSPIAVAQNLSCWIERYMDIFPNVKGLRVSYGEVEGA